MATIKLELPESTEIESSKKDPSGQEVMILKLDIVILDMLLAEAQSGFNVADDTQREAWLVKFADLLTQRCTEGYTMSIGDAWLLATTTSKLIRQLKKKSDGLGISSSLTDSPLSN